MNSRKQLISKLEETVRWQDKNIHNTEVPTDQKTRITVGLIDLALEHEKAIGILAEREFYGSVFALLRPLFEAYVRAIWVRYCASGHDIEKFKKNKLNKEFGSLINDIEKVEGYDVSVLSDIKSRNWKLMNDFTHGGIYQVASRNKPNEIAPNYPEEDVLGAISFTLSVGLLATMEVANVTNNEEFAAKVLEKIKNDN